VNINSNTAARMGPSPNMPEVYEIDPIADSRWSDFVKRHPRSSVFHTPQWLGALRRTYGYRPIVFSTDSPGIDLSNGIVFCEIHSWLTGNRLTSLPFSDHCEPLVDELVGLNAILTAATRRLRRANLQYAEIRPVDKADFDQSLVHATASYYLHRLDLRPGLTTLFTNCHKSSTQRKILRSDREGLSHEEGRSDRLLDAFHQLLVLTRKRHRLPPQPRKWFENLIGCLGESLNIWVAFKATLPVAAILTLRHKSTLVYKYGCSDSQFHNLGSMQFLFWQAIMDAKRQGLQVFDLGRSDIDNAGLVRFKDRWGSERSVLTYRRFTAAGESEASFAVGERDRRWDTLRTIIPHLPNPLLRSAGDVFYKHLG